MPTTPLTDTPWTVHIYQAGKHIGRLAPNGEAVNRKLFAAMLTRERAVEIADEINAGIGLEDDITPGTITARAAKF